MVEVYLPASPTVKDCDPVKEHSGIGTKVGVAVGGTEVSAGVGRRVEVTVGVTGGKVLKGVLTGVEKGVIVKPGPGVESGGSAGVRPGIKARFP